MLLHKFEVNIMPLTIVLILIITHKLVIGKSILIEINKSLLGIELNIIVMSNIWRSNIVAESLLSLRFIVILKLLWAQSLFMSLNFSCLIILTIVSIIISIWRFITEVELGVCLFFESMIFFFSLLKEPSSCIRVLLFGCISIETVNIPSFVQCYSRSCSNNK